MIPWLAANEPFPAVELALEEPNGLLAAGGELSVVRLREAYSHGIFPWFSEGQPTLWWSPDPRMVLFPPQLRVSRSLAKTLRNGRFEVRSDTAFRAVMSACSELRPEQNGTWITPPMIEAYCALHHEGVAHSVETWLDGELVGGLYGVALGRAFFGESMFMRATDASKVALVALVRQLELWGFGLVDCQMNTAHLASMGAREIPRAEFTRRLRELIHYPTVPAPWRISLASASPAATEATIRR